jgi:hypothetical protein
MRLSGLSARAKIARAIIDGRGLPAVHLNSIRHHHTQTQHTRGYNPLDFMAVGKFQEGVLSTPRYFLFEKQAMPNEIAGYKWEWIDMATTLHRSRCLSRSMPEFEFCEFVMKRLLEPIG